MNFSRKLHFIFSLTLVGIAAYGLLLDTPYMQQLYDQFRGAISSDRPNYKFALVQKNGELRPSDREILAGIDDQVKAVNKSDLGFTLSYELLADGETPEATEKIVFDIGAKPDILAVIGHDGYTNSKRAADYYLVTQMPFLSLTEKNFNLTEFNDWSFRLIFDEIRLANYVAERMNRLYAGKSLVVLTDGEGASPALLNALTQKIPSTQTISEKKVRKATQALFGLQLPDQDVVVLLLGRSEFVTGCLGKLMPTKMNVITMDDLDAEARSLVANESNLATVTLLSPVIPELTSVSAKKVAAEYASAHGLQPSWQYMLARSSVELLATAISQNAATFNTSQPDIRAMRKAVQGSWAASKSTSSSVATLMGQIFFDNEGNAASPIQAQDIIKGRSSLSASQFVIGADGGGLKPLAIIWASADLVGIEAVNGVDDSVKASFAIQLATQEDKSIFDDIVIFDKPLTSFDGQIQTNTNNGWTVMRGTLSSELPVEKTGTESLTDSKRVMLNIRHRKLDSRNLILVPASGLSEPRLLASVDGPVNSRQISNGQGVFLLGGFSAEDGTYNEQEMSQATFVYELQSPFQAFLERTFRTNKPAGLMLLLGIGVITTVWGAFAVARVRQGTLGSVLLPVILVAGLILTKTSLYLGWYEVDSLQLAYWLNKILLTGIVLAAGSVGLSFTNRLFRIVEDGSGVRVAGIVRTFVALGWWIMILGAVAFFVGGISLGQALATSGVLVFTIGLAIQPLILDAFSGLMLSIERPFFIGDWLELGLPGSTEPVTGRVVDANWRSVRLLSRDGNQVTVPNHVITSKHLINFSRPSPESRIEVNFCISNSYNLRAIMNDITTHSTQYCEGTSILTNPPPKIVVEELEDQGVELKLQAWYLADKHSPDTARTDLTHILGRVMNEGGWSYGLPTMRYIRVGDSD